MFLVPNTASIFCAAGMLLGDLKHDYVQSYLSTFSKIGQATESSGIGNELLNLVLKMKKNGTETLISEGVSIDNIQCYPIMDLRYIGQYHEVQLPVPWKDIEDLNLKNISENFHEEHNHLFGYSIRENSEIETINIRLHCVGRIDRPKFLSDIQESIPIDKALKCKREVFIPETQKMTEIPVYNGDMPIGNNHITGPAIIEKVNTSIFLSEIYNCIVDEYCSFIVYNKEVFPNGFKLNSGK
jgi:N-methylhydantoinase A